MSNGIVNAFAQLRRTGKKAFIAYLTAGFPSVDATVDCAVQLAGAGADIIELGVPFSDPMADGLTIQAASQRALENGITLDQIFEVVHRIRQKSEVPLALMTYYNPVFHYGEERFVKQARAYGVDGLIIPDLPPEEAAGLCRAAQKVHMSVIFFLAPTTKPKRMPLICKASTGFIYYVSLTGVTGERQKLDEKLWTNLRQARKMTDQPVCIGFGISTPEQVRQAGRMADGVIVGSAIIKEMERHADQPDMPSRVADFVRTLKHALNEVPA